MVLQGRPQRHGDRTDGGIFQGAPAKKKAFQSRLKAWQKEEKAIEKSMGEFAANHKNATYGATEAVAYYLMSDMGFQDDTPKGVRPIPRPRAANLPRPTCRNSSR